MTPLTPKMTEALKIEAQHLNPTVFIGHKGLTTAFFNELHSTLNAHELVKVKINVADKEERAQMVRQIVEFLDINLIQTIGKTAVFWQPKPEGGKTKTPKTETHKTETQRRS